MKTSPRRPSGAAIAGSGRGARKAKSETRIWRSEPRRIAAKEDRAGLGPARWRLLKEAFPHRQTGGLERLLMEAQKAL